MRTFLIIISLLLAISCQSPPSKNKLPSGYEFESYLKTGNPLPRVGQVVILDLEVLNEQGNILDDSKNTGIKPSVVIPPGDKPEYNNNPILSLLKTMGRGDSAMVRVPIDSLKTPPENFLKNKFVDYRIKVYNVLDANDYESQQAMKKEQDLDKGYRKAFDYFTKYSEKTLEAQDIMLPSGVSVHLINDTGKEKAGPGEIVEVMYYGFFRDGKDFDNSYKSGRAFKFTINESAVINGWHYGLQHVPKNGSAIIDIPYEHGYGAEGSEPVVPPFSDLIFYVEVVNVIKNIK